MSGMTIFGNRLRNGMLFKSTAPNMTKLIAPQHQWSTQQSGSDLGEVQGATDISFLPDRGIVVSEYGNARIQVFDITGKPKVAVEVSSLKPQGITIDKHAPSLRIAVVDQHRKTVRFYSQDGEDAGSWKKNMFGNPVAIAINSEHEFIVTDDHPDHPKVNVLTNDGQLLRGFGSLAVNAGDAFLAAPNYVTTDHFDRIIISDHARGCLKVFDTSGRYLTTIEGLRKPNGVCADAMDNILVAEAGSNDEHRVSLYSGTSSKLIQTVISDIRGPHGLDMSDAGFMALTLTGHGEDAVKFYQI